MAPSWQNWRRSHEQAFIFSPSASHRILACPPSLQLNANKPDETTTYAAEGTDAHELCAYLVEEALGHDVIDPAPTLKYYSAEMQNCAEGYRDFVMEEYQEIKKTCGDADILVEQTVDISPWVPGCGGTADCVILSDDTAEVIDYKHGLGVMVSAESEEFGGNPQLMCYCLGILNMYDGIYDISTIRMAIYQPRRSNVSIYTMSKAALLQWAEEVLKPTAALALAGKGEFKAGDHCRFCKVKATCRKRAEYNLRMAQYDFEMPDSLEDYEIDAILLVADKLTEWVNDIKEYALSEALNGKAYEHFKVVEGRSVRKYTSEEEVAEAVSAAGFDPYEKKLLGITAMTNLLGKKRFEELLGTKTCKPEGKPTLVPKTDKRPEMKPLATNDFNE